MIPNVARLLLDPQIAAFIVIVWFFGYILGGLEAFNFWYLSTLSKAWGADTNLLLMYVLLINSVCEVRQQTYIGPLLDDRLNQNLKP